MTTFVIALAFTAGLCILLWMLVFKLGFEPTGGLTAPSGEVRVHYVYVIYERDHAPLDRLSAWNASHTGEGGVEYCVDPQCKKIASIGAVEGIEFVISSIPIPSYDVILE